MYSFEMSCSCTIFWQNLKVINHLAKHASQGAHVANAELTSTVVAAAHAIENAAQTTNAAVAHATHIAHATHVAQVEIFSSI